MQLVKVLAELESQGVAIGNRLHSISSKVYEIAEVSPNDYWLDPVELASIRTLLIDRAPTKPVSETDPQTHRALQSLRLLIRRLVTKINFRLSRKSAAVETAPTSGNSGALPADVVEFKLTRGFVTPKLLSQFFVMPVNDVMKAVDKELFEMPASYPLSRQELVTFLDEMELRARELLRSHSQEDSWQVVSRMVYFGKRTSIVDFWFIHCEESRDALRADELRFLLESLRLFDANALLRWACVSYVLFGRDAIEPEIAELLSDSRSEEFRTHVVTTFRQRGFDPLQPRFDPLAKTVHSPDDIREKESKARSLFQAGDDDEALRVVWEVLTVMPGSPVASLGFKICRLSEDEVEAQRLKTYLELKGKFNDQASLDFTAVRMEIYGRDAIQAEIDELLRGKPDRWRRHVAFFLKLESSHPEREEEIALLLARGEIQSAVTKACEMAQLAPLSPMFLQLFEWCRENRAAVPASKLKDAVEKHRPLLKDELLLWTTTQIVCGKMSEENTHLIRVLNSAFNEETSADALQSMIDAGLDVARFLSLMTSEDGLKSLVSQVAEDRVAGNDDLRDLLNTSPLAEMIELLEVLNIPRVKIGGEHYWRVSEEQAGQFFAAWRLHRDRFPENEDNPEGRGRISKYHKMDGVRQLKVKRDDVVALVKKLQLGRLDDEFLTKADSVRLLAELLKAEAPPTQVNPPPPPPPTKVPLSLVMDGVDYSDQNFGKADFARCSARNCNFTRANLESVNFTEAVLDGSIFSHANLSGAIFDGASVVGADFSYVDLTRTSFNGVDLTVAKLVGAILPEEFGNQ